MLRSVVELFRKIWCKLARPKIIRVGINQEIKLTNISPEVGEKVLNLVRAELNNSGTTSEEEPETKQVELKDTAIGSFQAKDGCYCVAVLKFDAESGQAKVEEVIRAGMEKKEVQERFRILAIQKGATE